MTPLLARESVTAEKDAPFGTRTRTSSPSPSPVHPAAVIRTAAAAHMVKILRILSPIQVRLQDQHRRGGIDAGLLFPIPLGQPERAGGALGTCRGEALVAVDDGEPGTLPDRLAEASHLSSPVVLPTLRGEGEPDDDHLDLMLQSDP